MAKRLSWAVRLARAKERGLFTEDEWIWSSDWRTCAIGERYQWREGDRSDEEEDLGIKFLQAVGRDDIPEAERIYALIQALPPVEVKA